MEKNALEIKNNNITQFTKKLTIKNLNTYYSWFKGLLNKELVAFFVNNDIKSYYVGKIQSVDRNNITVKIVDIKGSWRKTKTFKISNIIYFSFRTQYEIRISKKLKNGNVPN